MRALKWIGGIVAAYVVFVFLFETLFLGWYQPKLEGTQIPMLVIITTDESGALRDRRLARFDTDERIYVSAHHWPRGWYHRAVENPAVQVEVDGVVADYVAVPVEGEEFQRVAAEHPIPFPVWFLMGFPPERQILRLIRRASPSARSGAPGHRGFAMRNTLDRGTSGTFRDARMIVIPMRS